MGHKVSPVGLRVGINKEWESTWYADKDFSKYLIEDVKIRNVIEAECKDALVSKTIIARNANNGTCSEVIVTIHVARTGVLLGQDDTRIKELAKKLTKIVKGVKVTVKVVAVENPDLDATIVAKQMAIELENRASFRMVQKKAIQRVMLAGAKGIKTKIGGRLGGADIARAEGYSEGVISLHTLRQDIDYASIPASTTYGRLGVKVWISKGEILKKRAVKAEAKGE